MADDGGYLLDNRQPEAGDRLDALGALFDASRFRHLDALGSPRAGGAGIDEHLADIEAGRLDLATSPMISTWGRLPA